MTLRVPAAVPLPVAPARARGDGALLLVFHELRRCVRLILLTHWNHPLPVDCDASSGIMA